MKCVILLHDATIIFKPASRADSLETYKVAVKQKAERDNNCKSRNAQT